MSFALARKHAMQIFRAALDAVDPERAVARLVESDGRVLRIARRSYPLTKIDRIFVVGAGKASAAMALGVERVLGRRVTAGVVNVPDGPVPHVRRIQLCPSRHPIPDERGMAGAEKMLALAKEAGPRDLVIAVISGGASALLPSPVPGLTLEAKQEITRKLLTAGANIHELNTVRKHLSQVKGGQLARAAHPARVVSLILSDVIGDDLDVIGSGPTVADRSTVEDARAVIAKFGVDVPLLALKETPKPGSAELKRTQNVIVASNRLAMAAAARQAKELGYRTLLLSSTLQGETKDVASVHAEIAKEILATGNPLRSPACILSGGETTVTVRGKGRGGRNQEFVLAALLGLGHTPNVTVFSAGTDGIDGPTDAAGAVAGAATLTRASELGMDPRAFLADNDSYRFFEPLNALVKTGPTGTNVMDVRVLLVG